MAAVRLVFQFIDGLMATFWGITLIEYITLFKTDLFKWESLINSGVQSIYIFVGLVYFILKGYHSYKMNDLERQAKNIQNKKLEEELNMEKWTNDEKKSLK